MQIIFGVRFSSNHILQSSALLSKHLQLQDNFENVRLKCFARIIVEAKQLYASAINDDVNLSLEWYLGEKIASIQLLKFMNLLT